jgi:general secretion pathway protein D
VDLRFMEVTRNFSSTYGLTLQNTFTLNALTTVLNNTVKLASNVGGLMTFGGGMTLFGIGIVESSVVAQMSDSNSKLLLSSYVQSMSGQKATMHIGEKYPIMTGGYSTGTAATGTTGVGTAPQFTFQDLGLTLTTTPLVHDTESVSLDIEAKYQVLTGQSINGLPVISNRSVQNTTRLKFGEWALIAGLLTTDEARDLSGIAGLARIPFLGPLTSMHQKTDNADQVIILMRPTLLAPPANEKVLRTFLTGSETRPLSPL